MDGVGSDRCAVWLFIEDFFSIKLQARRVPPCAPSATQVYDSMQEIPCRSRLTWPNYGSKSTPGSIVLREMPGDAGQGTSRDCRHRRRGGERQPRLGGRGSGRIPEREAADSIMKHHRVHLPQVELYLLRFFREGNQVTHVNPPLGRECRFTRL